MQELAVNIGPRAFDILLYLPKFLQQQCPAAFIHPPVAPQPGPGPAVARLTAIGQGGPGKQIGPARLKPRHVLQTLQDTGMVFFVAGQGLRAQPPAKRPPLPAIGRFGLILLQD